MISLQAEFYPVVTADSSSAPCVQFFRKADPPGLQNPKDWELRVEKDREFQRRALVTFAGARYTPAHIEKTMQMLRQHEAQKARNPFAIADLTFEPPVYGAPLQNAISIRNDRASLMDCFDIVSCAIGRYKPREAAERPTYTMGKRLPYKGAALFRIMRNLNLRVIDNAAPAAPATHYESWQPD